MPLRVLVSASKIDHDNGRCARVASAAAAVVRLADQAAEVVASNTLYWPALLQAEGSWDASYRWCARAFDAVCAVEVEGGTLSRGVYQIVEEFLRAGKRVVTWREDADGGLLLPVAGVRPTGEDDWKARYGVLVIG